MREIVLSDSRIEIVIKVDCKTPMAGEKGDGRD